MRQYAIHIRLGALLALAAMVACGGPDPEERMVRPVLVEGTAPWQPESSIPPTPKKLTQVIWEITEYADAPGPTEEQRRAADDLLERSFASAQKHGWSEFEKGMADGFEPMALDLSHFVNPEYVLDDALLDPDRPEFLMYHNTAGGGRVLTGFMYYVRRPRERGPQIGGPLTLWHYHVWAEPQCLEQGMYVVGRTYQGGDCTRGVAELRSPEMLHVWFLDRPEGPFGTSMAIDPAKLPEQIAQRRRERGW